MANLLSTNVNGILSVYNSSNYGLIKGYADNYHGMIFRGYPTAYNTLDVTAADVISFYEYGGVFAFYQKNSSGTLKQVANLGPTAAVFRTYASDNNYNIRITGGDQFNAYNGDNATTMFINWNGGQTRFGTGGIRSAGDITADTNIWAANGNGRIALGGNLHIDSYNGNDIYLNYYTNQPIRTYGATHVNGIAYLNGYTKISYDWAGGQYGAEQLTIRGTYPSIALRSTNNDSKWLIHHSNSLQFYYGGTLDDNSWGQRILFGADGNIWSSYYNDWLSNIFNSKQNASTAITTSNIGSQSVSYANSAGTAGQVSGVSISSSEANALKTTLGVTGLPYSVDIVVEGDASTYYPVHLIWGDQDVWRRIIIKRGYSEEAPWDPVGSGVHHGGLLLDWEGNFGGWGGADYSDRLRVFQESYTTICADMYRTTHSMGYTFFLRGGGAIYHIYSDQAIRGYQSSTAPDIAYDTNYLFYDHSIVDYRVYAPAPLTSVNSSRIDGLRTKKQSQFDDRYQQSSTAINTGNIGSQSVSYATTSGSTTGNAATTSQRQFDYIYTTSYLESAGAVYGTVFYDNNDRSYYVDPNGTSMLSRVNSYYLSNPVDVADNHSYGMYFSNNLSTAYAIFREGGDWEHPYPDLRIAFHTGIKIGANASYQGVRFYTDYDMSSQVMSVNNGSDPLGGGNVYVNNSLQAGSSLRAPIFYDSNDTTYYLDPNAGTSLKIAGGIVSTAANGAVLLKHENAEANAWIFQENAANWGLFWFNAGGESGQTIGSYTIVGAELFGMNNALAGYNPNSAWSGTDASTRAAWMLSNYSGYLWTQGTQYSETDMRAPIFYDSEDTGYYVDPNSNSKLVNLGLGGATPDVRLSVSGDIHMDGYIYQGGTAGVLNSWGSRTYVNSGNYVSNANSFAFNNVGYGASWTFAIDSGGSVTTNRHIDANTTWSNDAIALFLGWYGGKVVIGNNNNGNHDAAAGLGGNTVAVTNPLYSFSSTYSPIFYSSNDSGYYLYPSSTGSSLVVAGYTKSKFTYRYNSAAGLPGQDNPVKTATGVLATLSGSGGGYEYIIIKTRVPQDSYQMGGFTIDLFANYGSTNAKTTISLGGYWNAESNNGFEGWEYNTTNPNVRPSIQVMRDVTDGSTCFAIQIGKSYPVIVARDLYLGYNASDIEGWLDWSIFGADDLGGYTNNDTVVCRNAMPVDNWYGNSYIGYNGAHYGTIFYDASDTNYYVDPNSTSSLYKVNDNGGDTYGYKYFFSNVGSSTYIGAGNAPSLQAYSNDAGPAFMSFHRGGYYAVNFGLDPDNVLRLGGWSASSNRMQLDMSGNVTFAGDVTAYSDARVKENVHTIENALDKTLQLRGVTYNRTDSEDKSTKVGVIAQEVLEVVPEVVNQDASGMYNVSYGTLTAVLIEAIKEQQKQIDELKEIINGLTK